ncbi:hypothetical protein ONE63_008400 [Megalurothrips usitatus]|uniref:Large ribosomal subunit protein mL62 n=1 Tax=Megalurothrips usitatus TaxID=439358 RepID=A0AAV7XNJ3_9NEOP|nr:hypothetical protein ONE63_008400 [Megalurothrips usitatus]
MNVSVRCLRFLPNQLWHSGRCFNVTRSVSFESSISLRNLYPTSSLTIKTPSPTEIPQRDGQRFNGYIPIEQLKITATRSSGPGGQHANKVSTKVDVRFHIDDAKWLDDDLRQKIKTVCKTRITSDGYLFVTSDRTRSKQLNIANCLEKLREMIWKAEGPEVKELSDEDKALQMKRLEAANRERLMKKKRRSADKQHRNQELLQRWVRRLAAAADHEHAAALDYARYLAYQLQRKQLRFPFSQPPGAPGDGPLPDLKDVLFGADSVAATDALNTSLQLTSLKKSARDRSLDDGSRAATGRCGAFQWASLANTRRADARPGSSPWDGQVVDPKGARDITVHLEELPEDAALWLLLTRICPHTRDAGALMHAVVAEELAEWSARLAAEQTLANQSEDQDEEEWAWAAKADHRADYWHEVQEMARQTPRAADLKAAGQFTASVDSWLRQQSRQLQAERAQLKALTEELHEVKRQIQHSQKWRESQFTMQNRVLHNEIAALKQR